MAKVDTNAVRLAYARESTAGTKADSDWRTLEPNEITQFGANITTTPREPISDRLQRRKGTTTDLDAPTAFAADLTIDGFLDWIEGALFSTFQNVDVRDIDVTGVTTTGYTLASGTLDSDAIAKFAYTASHILALAWADGFDTDGNNGLKVISAAATATKVSVASLTAESNAGHVSLAGVRVVGASSGVTFAYSSTTKRATLTKTGLGTAVHGKGLYYGQIVHFGSIASKGDDKADLQNGVPASGGDVYGYARYVDHTADTLVFDRLDDDLEVSSSVSIGASDNVDICYSDFVENVARSNSDYQQIAHTIELTSPDLLQDTASPPNDVDGYEYAVGQVVGTLTLNLPLTEKATMSVAFVGQDTEAPVTTRQTGASTAEKPRRTEAINTSADFARLRINDVDDAGITTDFKSLTATVNPQTSPEKVLGKLGAKFINRGNLLVDVQAQVIFSSGGVPKAIRNNETVRFDTILANDDGVIALDMPSMTMGGGGREYPTDQAVLINGAAQSFEDDDFGTSLMVSILLVPIPTT